MVHAAFYSGIRIEGRLDAALGNFLVVVPHFIVVQLGQVAVQIFLEQAWLLITISGLSGPFGWPIFLPLFFEGRLLFISVLRMTR